MSKSVNMDDSFTSVDILLIAGRAHVPSDTVTAYCMHHLTTCKVCTPSSHRYCKPKGGVAYSEHRSCYLIGVSTNREWARYIPARYAEVANNYLKSRGNK